MKMQTGLCTLGMLDQLIKAYQAYNTLAYLATIHFRNTWTGSSYMIVSTCRKLRCVDVYLHKKSTSSLTFFLEILQRFWKLVALGTSDMTIHTHQN